MTNHNKPIHAALSRRDVLKRLAVVGGVGVATGAALEEAEKRRNKPKD